MAQRHHGDLHAAAQPHLRGLSTREIVTELARKASLLAHKEVALVKAEAREDLRSEMKMASGLGVAGVCALTVLQLLLLALVLALAEAGVLRGWLAALVVAAVVLAIGSVAGFLGWRRRVREPLDATRRSLSEGVRWVKERTA
jgi:Putative Actinobacterial Holin-X, holin superfamily III